ncbi:MAG: ABC transporter ATP-binding protein [Lewinellaceae bacterium]|nr:ABC transporter ATP-binding protein [Lewinellaceae bacterium]
MSLIIKNLYFQYTQKEPILSNISISINIGEKIAIMGASGMGKSTLLKVLVSYLSPSSGDIFFKSVPLNGSKPFSNMAYVSQSSYKSLFPWLNLRENVYYPLVLRNKLNKENQNYCDQLIQKLNLSHRTNSYPNNLSGGEQKRLTLAIALSYKPELFFLDEPFAGIDFRLTEELWDFLYQYFSLNNTTVLFASHNIDEVSIILTV